jgi:antitoxin ParD1/3/4
MAVTLDPAAEERIQRELERGHYREPAEVIAHALNLLQAEEEWLEISKSALNLRLAESMAQIERGEGIPGDQLLEVLAARRQSQNPRA